jgi:hypothetical protein
MPIETWIDTRKHRVHAILSGRVTLHEMIQAIDSSVEDSSFRNGIDIFSDHTRLEKPIETDQAQKLVTYLRKLKTHFVGSRWAVVTKMQASFGMMRMLSVLLEKIPMELSVFYSFVEAERWLSLPKNGSVEEPGATLIPGTTEP